MVRPRAPLRRGCPAPPPEGSSAGTCRARPPRLRCGHPVAPPAPAPGACRSRRRSRPAEGRRHRCQRLFARRRLGRDAGHELDAADHLDPGGGVVERLAGLRRPARLQPHQGFGRRGDEGADAAEDHRAKQLPRRRHLEPLPADEEIEREDRAQGRGEEPRACDRTPRPPRSPRAGTAGRAGRRSAPAGHSGRRRQQRPGRRFRASEAAEAIHAGAGRPSCSGAWA